MPTVTELVEKLGSGDQAEAYRAKRALGVEVAKAGAKDAAAARSQLAANLAAELGAVVESKNDKGETNASIKYSPAIRNQVARFLAEIAGASEVPALAKALSDFQTREMARWALDRVPDDTAGSALIGALREAIGPEYRVGIVNALSHRQGEEVRQALISAIEDPDGEVRIAAAEALASHPNAAHDAKLVAVLAAAGGNSRTAARVFKARLRLAGALASNGQKDAARAVYQAVAKDAPGEAQKKAAQAGLEQLA